MGNPPKPPDETERRAPKSPDWSSCTRVDSCGDAEVEVQSDDGSEQVSLLAFQKLKFRDRSSNNNNNNGSLHMHKEKRKDHHDVCKTDNAEPFPDAKRWKIEWTGGQRTGDARIMPGIHSLKGLRDRGILLVVSALYGIATIALRQVAIKGSSPSASILSTLRTLLMAACFVPCAIKMLLSKGQKPNLNDWGVASELALYNFGFQGFFTVGLYLTDATVAAFLTQASVIVTPILSFFLGEMVTFSRWCGCVIALIGVGLLTESQARGSNASGGTGGLLGPSLCLCGAICWSLYICRYSRFMKQRGDCQPASASAVQTWKMFVLVIIHGFWALIDVLVRKYVKNQSAAASVIWPGCSEYGQWVAILVSALSGALGHWLQGIGQKSVSSSEANVILSTEPLWTALLVFVFFNHVSSEMRGIEGLLGGGLLIAAAVVSSGMFDSRISSQNDDDLMKNSNSRGDSSIKCEGVRRSYASA